MARSASVGLLLALLAGCATPSSDAPDSAPTDWEQDLARLDQAVKATATWADADPRAWTRRAAHAGALADRARHRGSLDDFAAAEAALDQAFAAAAEGSGPWLQKASLDASLHRFSAAQEAANKVLSGVVVSDEDRSVALGLLGRIALERDDLDLATEHLTAAHELDPTPTAWANLAVLEQKTGDLAAAEAHWRAASSACDCAGERFDGWVQLQRGLVHLDDDRPADALVWFTDAEARYSGDWVFQEHRAEALASTGQLAEADAEYARAIATVRDAEVLGAWAGVKRSLGEDELADSLIAEARAGFEAALDRFPEAAAGHAVDFFVEHGPAERALQAARADAEARPTADRLARVKELEAR